jgi:hypothetical protein
MSDRRSRLWQLLYDFLEDYNTSSMTGKLDAVKRAIDGIESALLGEEAAKPREGKEPSSESLTSDVTRKETPT